MPAKKNAAKKKLTKKPAKRAAPKKKQQKATANKTAPTGGSLDAYFASIEDPQRRADVKALHELIRRVAPSLEPKVWGQFIGYGSFHYRYASGREGDWFVLGLAGHMKGISVYACAVSPEGGYVPEKHKDALKPASVGRSCIRFASLAKVDVKALERVLREAATSASHAM